MASRVRIARLLRLLPLVLAFGAGAYVVVTLPPAQVVLTAVPPTRPVATGVVHVHTVRSDGTGSGDRVAAAAERTGLGFVVITDHGDATRRPDPPAYIRNVLVIDAVEISADGGHYVALGLPRAPYPLGGDARDVVADVARLGGFGVVAHPGSPKDALRWHDWAAPFDGMEWLNGDSEWRDETWATLGRTLAQYFLRGPEALASLLDRPDPVLARWDAITDHRRVFAIAGSDAHARLGLRANTDPYPSAAFVRIPSYETAFRALSIAVDLGAPLTRDAARDATAVLAALRAGHASSIVTGMATPGRLEFTAASGAYHARAGDLLAIDGPIELRARVDGPPGTELVLLRRGRPVASASAPDLQFTAPPERGAYRVEARVPGAPGSPAVPWIVSNPIYAGITSLTDVLPAHRDGVPVRTLYADGGADAWHAETSAGSVAAIETTPAIGGRQLMFRWGLAGGVPQGQFAAAVLPISGGLLPANRILFRARASQPMRLSVQVRAGGAGAGARWRRSVFLDEAPRDVTVWLDEIAPVGEAGRYRPDLSTIASLLFVVDTVHARPGSNGTVFLDDIRLEQPAPATSGR